MSSPGLIRVDPPGVVPPDPADSDDESQVTEGETPEDAHRQVLAERIASGALSLELWPDLSLGIVVDHGCHL